MEYKDSKSSEINMSLLMTPSHSNFSGKIHGGYILSLMDEIAFSCASKYSGHYCVTASVNKVDFLQPVEVGELLHLKASINYTGKSSMVVGLRVESENIRTGEVKHCNSSYFTMVAKSEDGKKVQVPGLILDSIESVRRFARSIERQKQALVRINNFKSSDFRIEDYLPNLKSQNAKITLSQSKKSGLQSQKRY
ncbi:MAG: acyl-CoA thioesterase [Crocinitomicaceae bacterium]|nr:acyl-CoA thioesterase [Crocinitomicaceae bacterium]